jgi:hypothetical protein
VAVVRNANTMRLRALQKKYASNLPSEETNISLPVDTLSFGYTQSVGYDNFYMVIVRCVHMNLGSQAENIVKAALSISLYFFCVVNP